MARTPNEKQIVAKKLFDRGFKLIDISKELDVPEGTIRSWKNRGNWDGKNNATLQKTESKKRNVAKNNDINKKGNINKTKAISSDKNSLIYKTQSRMARPGNKNAEVHGFFSKYLPKDTLEIIKAINEKEPLDILWENIQIQYAAILRAQNIMYVENKDEMIKEIKKKKEAYSDNGEINEIEYEFQFAWDRQATFLNAQSRAMAELRGQIKQYDEMLHKNWDMATEEQKLRINKLKADIENSGGNNKTDEAKLWANAIQEIAAKRRDNNG
ncbi:phage terminase small subunit [Clostridium beijerinckii]|uniref:phage terminase small subunit n=1 Tax=Clostridium beijerinckii TaxID=1520 RepID=UPI00098BDE43|nr:phage terminase small subunit [Clostridium beijerinckii]MBA8937249.1 uncharacterized protein YjcR [Clostridium beijerinckii]NRU40285.1 uncharacterized protein YjcR [Clostridium beijerinckii]NSA96438.1 uncharacterized protein YjcR [Clostridium beijerinckii]OOM60655.1 phage terminase small subunit [Clostridium beijerinckii]OOM68577.1 phage terminase small subunit [Clostridium beijerinckii]